MSFDRNHAVAASLTLTLAVIACRDDGTTEPSHGDRVQFSQEELDVVATLSPLPPPPPDTTNQYADSEPAAKLGRLLFWDKTADGHILVGTDFDSQVCNGVDACDYRPDEIGPWNDQGGTPLAFGPAGSDQRSGCQGCHGGLWGHDVRETAYWPLSLGAKWTSRNTPAIVDTVYYRCWDLDCHADSMWQQALGAWESGTQQNGSRIQIAKLIFDHYRAEYEAMVVSDGQTVIDGAMVDISTYGLTHWRGNGKKVPPAGAAWVDEWEALSVDQQKIIERIAVNAGKALAAYERTLTSRDAPFDRWVAGDKDAISVSAQRGLKLFLGSAKCIECHRGPAFTDNDFHNIGIPQGFANSGVFQDVSVDDGLYLGLGKVLQGRWNRESVWSDDPHGEGKKQLDWFRQLEKDGGCDAAVSATCTSTSKANKGLWRTGTLRNVAETGPWFHNGSASTLKEVILHYRNPPTDNRNGHSGILDERLAYVTISSDQDVVDLVAFLKTLTGIPPENFSPVGVR